VTSWCRGPFALVDVSSLSENKTGQNRTEADTCPLAYESVVLFLSVLIVNQTLSDGRSK
jgi:hypothetical protein